jgi:predicted DNA-binding protein (MmcQ/YjbR family)
MDLESVRTYCLAKKAVTESLPFDDETLVFKVAGKIFSLLSLSGDWGMNLKCDPEKAVELREQYPEIVPGYHMNKAHWNTIQLNGNLSEKMIFDLIDHSYQLIVNSLSRKQKIEFNLD